MTADELKAVLADHALWLSIKGGKRANLTDANLTDATLTGANLARANLARANLTGANLTGANLTDAYLTGAYLNYCTGNMREIRSMQIDTWAVTYTADTLQIGCQRHTIEKWRKWDSDAGRKWVAQMGSKASDWADRNLPLILAVIDANPATPTGHEAPAAD